MKEWGRVEVLGITNNAAFVGPRERLQAISATTCAVLARINLGLDGVTEMDWLVNVEKKTPRDATRTWIQANETRVAGWLKACRSTDSQPIGKLYRAGDETLGFSR